jgi:predicted TIM-barrel fold metal-dependent hydrolase
MVAFRSTENECIEDAIDQDRPIVDAHHHLWDYPGRSYLFSHFAADLATGHNIVATVHVEAVSMYTASGPTHLKPVGETEFVRGAAAMSASGNYGSTQACKGIVGFVDLSDTDVHIEEAIEAHRRAAGGRFRGIRDGGTWDADQSIRRGIWQAEQNRYGSSGFRRGFARLAAHDLTFDAWLYHPQLDEVCELARAFPETTIIVDHVGGLMGQGAYRANRSEAVAQWRRSIEALAKLPNVRIKLGGLGMWTGGFDFEVLPKSPSSQVVAEALAPYIEYCIECFGAERAMFESNFPADKPAYSYGVIWNAFKRIAKRYTPSEQHALFFETANQTYRLGL